MSGGGRFAGVSGASVQRSRELGREMVLSRVRRLRSMALPIVQSAVAAGLAWVIATDVFDHKQAFFAPIAVVLCIGVGLGRRLRRVAELVVGVSVGIGVGDLLVSAIGTGAWQIALVVALAMTVSVFLDGGALITLQAGSSAVLVATLLPPGGHGGVNRMLDAFIGGLVGLATVVLLPGDPPGITRSHGQRIFAELAAALSGAAEAHTRRDAELAERSLSRARSTQQTIDDFRAALAAATEIAAFSPLRRRRRRRLGRYSTAAVPLDHALRNARVLLRRTVAAIHAGEPVPEPILTALDELAGAAVLLGRELADGQEPVRSAGKLRETAVLLDLSQSAAPSGHSAHVVFAQTRSLTVDLLEATGLDHESALAVLPPPPAAEPGLGARPGSDGAESTDSGTTDPRNDH